MLEKFSEVKKDAKKFHKRRRIIFIIFFVVINNVHILEPLVFLKINRVCSHLIGHFTVSEMATV